MLDFTFRCVINSELTLIWCEVWMEFNFFVWIFSYFHIIFLKDYLFSIELPLYFSQN